MSSEWSKVVYVIRMCADMTLSLHCNNARNDMSKRDCIQNGLFT